MFWDTCPHPQSLNEPKSLYQGPSGTSGFDSSQTRSRLRSSNPIVRSCIRWILVNRLNGFLLWQRFPSTSTLNQLSSDKGRYTSDL